MICHDNLLVFGEHEKDCSSIKNVLERLRDILLDVFSAESELGKWKIEFFGVCIAKHGTERELEIGLLKEDPPDSKT